MSYLVAVLILISYIFTFINGIHDGGNVVATIISSRSMKPKKALLIASISEFIFPLFMGTAVASTIGKGIIKIQLIQSVNRQTALIFILAALIGAIVWNIITWIYSLPSSSSHALIGGLIGSGWCAFGIKSIEWGNILVKVVLMLFLTPIIGFITGIIFISIAKYFSNKFTNHINGILKMIQTLSMVFLAASHSINDSQKSMGIVTLILIIGGTQNQFTIPLWSRIIGSLILALGLYLGGLRIVRTVGSGIFRLKPMDSFASQLSAASVIFISGMFGAPVSTSQIVSSSIMGVGTGKKFRCVKWDTVKKILISWVTTIPSAALIAYFFISLIFKFL